MVAGKVRPIKSRGGLTTANISWFNDGCCDIIFLDLWEDVPLSYFPDQVADQSWHIDHYELIIGHDDSGALFRRAADLLMRYRFYPPRLLSFTGDFDLVEPRWLEIGDRIIQRIHLFKLFGFHILDVICVVEISQVIIQPRYHGFTYATVGPHVEQGEWSAHVEWQDNNDVVVTVDAISRPALQEPTRNHALIRSMQTKAHRQGLAHFKQAVLS